MRLGAGNDHVVVRGGPARRDIVHLDAGNDTLEVYPRGRVSARLGGGNDKVVLFGDAWEHNFIDCGTGARDSIRARDTRRSRNCERHL
jgi:hypothetical protein